LIRERADFAFESTLSTKSYTKTIQKAKENGYLITMLFFWLDSTELAIERVKIRVQEGGHDIPKDVIIRRYKSGLRNLFNLYIPICDYWMIFNNSTGRSELVADGQLKGDIFINNSPIFDRIKKSFNDK
jgi:predicted ABC-type ATPase